MTSAILMSAVTHQFGKRSTPLFEGLDLDVATHESVAVMGESGSGKSTLLVWSWASSRQRTGRCPSSEPTGPS